MSKEALRIARLSAPAPRLVEIVVPHAQVLTLFSRGVELVPPPGVGFWLQLLRADMYFEWVANYVGSNGVKVSYGVAGATAGNTLVSAHNPGASKWFHFSPVLLDNLRSVLENKPLTVFYDAVGDFTGAAAGNLWKVYAEYVVRRF